jgi:hypothetical protein
MEDPAKKEEDYAKYYRLLYDKHIFSWNPRLSQIRQTHRDAFGHEPELSVSERALQLEALCGWIFYTPVRLLYTPIKLASTIKSSARIIRDYIEFSPLGTAFSSIRGEGVDNEEESE